VSERTDAQKDLARNRQAFHLYEIGERFEAGMVLLGPEVKSIREGKVQLKDAYARVEGGEVWLHQCHVSPYSHHTHEGLTPIDPMRKRKLLLHKQEILKLQGRVDERGLSLVPLRLFLAKGKIKCELGLGRGKKLYDKKAALKERELDREQARAMKER
jgi:SsrA-binding protein